MANNREMNEIYATPNDPSPTRPVVFDASICNGCNVCVDICVQDVFIPNPEQGKPPILLYPDECWYDGNCVLACKRIGAIKFNVPLMWRTAWRDRDTGELHWVGKNITD